MFDHKTLDALPVIIDNGSGLTKAGIGGENFPRLAINTVVGRSKVKATAFGACQKEHFIGGEVQAKRGTLTLRCPIERGVISSWDDMEKIWKYVYEELKVKAGERPLLMSEPPLNPLPYREKMTEIMFDTLKVPAMYLSVQATLALYASAQTTGLVVDSGDGITETVPIYDGYYLPHAVCKLDVAGNDITEYLAKLLMDTGHSFAASTEKDLVKDIKEELAYVAADPCKEIKKRFEELFKEFTLPDGKVIQIGNQLFRAPEILFSPPPNDGEIQGIHRMIFKSVMKCEDDLRRKLYGNMILSGGSTLFPGLDERILKEIQQLAPSGIPVRIIAPSDRKVSTWVGASIITSLTSFKQMWVTSSDYKEFGSGVVHRRCF
ncbi:actin-related protein T2-like [Ambystoma mexicanum]|uniref:actin-related protein T2-like n=1 Tax=Ambystoma mexicanum TaxID=8296 RepID=UPI0037E76EC9